MGEYRTVLSTRNRSEAIQRARDLNRKRPGSARLLQRGDTYIVQVVA